MGETEPEDVALLGRVAAGDSDALLILHERYVNQVYSVARRVLGDGQMAEEVTQDVFMKLWQKSQRYDARLGRFSTWLLSVTRFAAIDRLRHEGRRPAFHFADAETDAEEPGWQPRDHGEWEQGRHLRLLLEQLPAEQREAIELAYFGGLTHSEMAEQLHVPLGTIKGRLRLGLEKLRSLWLDEPGKSHGTRSS
jgi:RNA polymerase sigma-70 factor, ECF subfamily